MVAVPVYDFVVLPGEDIRAAVNRQLDEKGNPLSEECARTLVQCTTALRSNLIVDELTGELVQSTRTFSLPSGLDVSVRCKVTVYPAEGLKPVRHFIA